MLASSGRKTGRNVAMTAGLRTRLPHAQREAKGQDEGGFFREEQRALKPFQPGLFDELPDKCHGG